MEKITSRDGTSLALERIGNGPPLVLIGGALQHRALDRLLGQRAQALSRDFTIYHYDRRGRGDSLDCLPYAVEREIDDLERVIDAVGMPVPVLGLSSGGALALRAAERLGERVSHLVVFEVPFSVDPGVQESWRSFAAALDVLLKRGEREAALRLFFQQMDIPAATVDAMGSTPGWPLLLAVAHTLSYDMAVLGEGIPVPMPLLAKVETPALVIDGSNSFVFVQQAADAIAVALPHATRLTLSGQTHAVEGNVLARAVLEYLSPRASNKMGSRP